MFRLNGRGRAEVLAGSHIALGAAAWVLAAPLLGRPPLDPASLALAVAGGLLPDIDHPKSWVGRRLRPVSVAIAAVFGHRGITHSLLAVAGCAALLRGNGWALPLVIGYLSHLGGDLLTPGGLRLAWPLRGTWALPLCRTGSVFEPLVVALVIAVAWCSLPARPEPLVWLRREVTRLVAAPPTYRSRAERPFPRRPNGAWMRAT